MSKEENKKHKEEDQQDDAAGREAMSPPEESEKQEQIEISEEDMDILGETSSDDESSKTRSPVQIRSKEQRAPPKLNVIEHKEEIVEVKKESVVAAAAQEFKTNLFVLKTTANREDQVLDFIASNAQKKKLGVFSLIRPHGMRGYIFIEAATRSDAEQAAFNIPYARGILSQQVQYKEIEHMLEQVKREVNIRKNDIVEIISGPFKREKAKISRIDKTKEEVVVELLESAVPIPITLKLDTVKVIRRDNEEPKGDGSDEDY